MRCRKPSRQATYIGSTASEFKDQKLLSAMRNSDRTPNNPMARTVTRNNAGQIPSRGDVILRETILTQAEATSGASPSSRPGTTNSIVQDKISLGRLISASKLPASDSSERRLVLDASSSTSPPRGSMTGFMAGSDHSKHGSIALFSSRFLQFKSLLQSKPRTYAVSRIIRQLGASRR